MKELSDQLISENKKIKEERLIIEANKQIIDVDLKEEVNGVTEEIIQSDNKETKNIKDIN